MSPGGILASAGLILSLTLPLVAGSSATYPTTGGGEARVLFVTTLDDAGPGSLREALETKGPRVIQFSVAGEIWLKDALKIEEPFVTVAGESAPRPGITILGDGIHLNTHDVILRHLRIRVGALLSGTEPQNRDGVAINGGRNVLVENCSVTWAQDENIQIWGEENRDIVIRNCLIAEGLRHSLHPKISHSAGLIVGPGTTGYLLQGNLFASNAFRNPVVTSDTTGFIVNNLVYNPGNSAVHVYGRDGPLSDTRLVVGIVGNHVIAGPDTRTHLSLFQKKPLNPGSQIYLADNLETGVSAFDAASMPPGWPADGPSPFVVECPILLPGGVSVLPVAKVEEAVLAGCGARPSDRDETDRRIVQEVRNRAGCLVDVPSDPRLTAGLPATLPAELREYSRLLATYAAQDGVQLAAWRSRKGDLAALGAVLEVLAKEEPADLATALNIHNAAVLLHLITAETGKPAQTAEIRIAGKLRSLAGFAGEIKERFPDPRVPFALYEGKRAGPRLLSWPFWQPFIRTQLDLAVGAFVNGPGAVAEKDDELWLSPIFERERDRFPDGTIAFIKKYSGKYPRATRIHYLTSDNAPDESE